MKRKLAWVCLLVLLVLLGGAGFLLLDGDRITKANCDRIKNGMTEKEVVTILGREKDELSGWGQPQLASWHGSRGTIMVNVNIAEPPYVVIGSFFIPTPPRTIVDKVRNWLGW